MGSRGSLFRGERNLIMLICEFGWSDLFGLINSVIAGVVAIIAWQGLSSWKNQKRWESRHRVAIKVLSKLIEIKNASNFIREPIITGKEKNAALKKYEKLEYPKEAPDYDYVECKSVYMNRWAVMRTALSEVEEIKIDIEVFWTDDKLLSNLEKMIKLVMELQEEIDKYVDERRPDYIHQNIKYLEDSEKSNEYIKKRQENHVKKVFKFSEDDKLGELMNELILDARKKVQEYFS